jgi:hypothetical protein
MRFPLWLAIAIGVVGVSILIVAYFVVPWIQYQSFLVGAGAILTAFGAISGGIIGALGLLREFFKDRKESIKERNQRFRQHTMILNDEVYKKLLHIFVEQTGSYGRKREFLIPVNEQEYKKYEVERILHPMSANEIPLPRLNPLSSIELLKLGIDHLKHRDYQEVYSAWTKLESLIEEYNGLVDSLDEELTQTVRKKMQDNFPEFADWESDTTSEGANFYYPRQIVPFISRHVFVSLAARSQPNFENTLEIRREKENVDQPPSSYPWNIIAKTFLNLPLLHSTTEIDLERMRSTLIEITNEGEIIKKMDRMVDILHIEIGESKKAFEKGIQKLAKDIDDPHDDYLIKGKCEKCKDWNK